VGWSVVIWKLHGRPAHARQEGAPMILIGVAMAQQTSLLAVSHPAQ